MALTIVNIVFAIIAVVLYQQSPIAYNYDYCYMLMWVYIVHNICFFTLNKKKHWLGFELFFAISFFFVNFVYPVTYATASEDQIRYQSFFIYMLGMKHNVVTRATAIAYLGYAFYALGISSFMKTGREEPDKPTFKLTQEHYLWFFGITVVSFLLFYLTGGLTALRLVYHGGGNLKTVGVYSYFNNIFTLACYLMAIFLFRLDKQKWWFYALVILTCMLITMSTGSRQMALGLMLVLLCSFSMYVYKFKWWQVAVIIAGGAFALFLIVSVRKLGWDPYEWKVRLQHLTVNNYFEIFNDLIVNDLNLFILVEYGLDNPLTWFHGMLIDIASPIPGLGSRIVEYYGEPIELLHGGDLPTYLIVGPNQKWGSGTNMVGEAFRSFGIWGVGISMFLIGYVVKELYYHANRNIYCYLLYFLFVSHAVIYPRAPLLFDPRTLTWSVLMLWIVLEMTKDSNRFKGALDKLWSKNGKELLADDSRAAATQNAENATALTPGKEGER